MSTEVGKWQTPFFSRLSIDNPPIGRAEWDKFSTGLMVRSRREWKRERWQVSSAGRHDIVKPLVYQNRRGQQINSALPHTQRSGPYSADELHLQLYQLVLSFVNGKHVTLLCHCYAPAILAFCAQYSKKVTLAFLVTRLLHSEAQQKFCIHTRNSSFFSFLLVCAKKDKMRTVYQHLESRPLLLLHSCR